MKPAQLQTAIHLARLSPARLILAVRDTEKGGLASKMIEEVTPFRGVEVWKLDLASFASVRAFAKRCDTELERLDIVVENAGVATERFEKTDDGWEKTIQVNDLSTGLLAVLLLPLLAKTALLPAIEGSTLKPHLCIVGSEGQSFSLSRVEKVSLMLFYSNSPSLCEIRRAARSWEYLGGTER